VLYLGKYSLPQFRRRPVGKSFHEYMARKLHIDMDTWFDSIMSIHDLANEGKYSEKEAIVRMAKNLKKDPEHVARLFRKSYRFSFVKNRKLVRYAKRLKRAGFRIAILSDQWELAAKELIIPEFRTLFNPVVVSCEVKLKKPDPRVYKYTLKKLKLKPQECVFIDNRDYNLIPAKKMGMHVILFESTRQTIRDLKKLGVVV